MLALQALLFLTVLFGVYTQKVTIPNGVIQGRQEYSRRGISFYAFQQIPYAKPPVGVLRFKEPQPAERWNDVLDATKNNKFCFQQNFRNALLENEDCLYLNVYTPVYPSTNVSLPVMYYIHGGGFVDGSGNFDYNGPHYWMEHGVILVTINYRVGPFGFLSTGDTTIPGNYGLKDQLLGLKWVQQNIRYFGGDPTKVTLLGLSAGGASATYQLMSKKSKGLFRAAISESGSVLCPWAYQMNHRDIAYSLASYIDPNFDRNATSQELLAFLQSVPASKLNEAASTSFPKNVYIDQLMQGFLFAPALEPPHKDAFITERMYRSVMCGHMQRVPLIIGINSEEMIWRAQNLENFQRTAEAVDNNLTMIVNDNLHLNSFKAEKERAGEAIRRIYTDGLFQDNLGKLIQLYSDMSFGLPIIHHAKTQSRFSDVYFYQFSYYGNMGGQRPYVAGAERVSHADDNIYLWVYNNNSNLNDMVPNDILTSQRYRTLFTNFAKNLDPVSENTEVLGINVWPKLRCNDFSYLDINETLTIRKDLKKAVIDGWVKVYDEMAVKPFETF